MNVTESVLIGILKAFATDSKPEFNIEDVNLEELFGLAKMHSVIGIVAYVLNKYGYLPDGDICSKFMHEYDRTIMQMSSREFSAARVIAQLQGENIPHILFKGMKISEAYPISELRTYGDVDIIIRKEDENRLCEMLKAQGYSHAVADAGVVNEFKKNREHYEFHTNLNVSNISDSHYFANMWENACKIQSCSYQFTHDFHLSYLITHLEKHVHGRGAGLRMYLDIALYIRKYSDELSLDTVRSTLTECGLGNFFNTVLYVCNKWFDLSIPSWVTPLSADVYGKMCAFTLDGGVFGERCVGKKVEASVRRELESGKKAVRLRIIMHRIFPPFSELCRVYPFFSGKPLLAPVAWVRHTLSFFKGDKLSKVKEITSVNVDEAAQQKEFLSNIGSSR